MMSTSQSSPRRKWPHFSFDASYISSDFETENGPNSTSMMTACRIVGLKGRGMFYLSTGRDEAVRKILGRREMSLHDGIAMIYGYHFQRAEYVNDGRDSEGKRRCRLERTVATECEEAEDSDPESADYDSDATSGLEQAAGIVAKKTILVEVPVDVPSGPDDHRWVDPIKSTVLDVSRLMDNVGVRDLFRSVVRLAGVQDTVKYILRCGKTPEDVMKVLGRDLPLRELAVALLACGYTREEVRSAARNSRCVYDQRDIDDAGLNTESRLLRLQDQCRFGSDCDVPLKAADNGKAPMPFQEDSEGSSRAGPSYRR